MMKSPIVSEKRRLRKITAYGFERGLVMFLSALLMLALVGWGLSGGGLIAVIVALVFVVGGMGIEALFDLADAALETRSVDRWRQAREAQSEQTARRDAGGF